MNFHDWLHRRLQHETTNDQPPTIVADELIRRLAGCGPGGVSKRDLLAGMRREGSPTFHDLIAQWASLGEIEVWKNEAGETMLRWAGAK